ncbi:MAG TPA: hypothetical protein VHW44_06970 [Pseudonocardiaceae bacterium]|nr:hypothetical protein [Pseudonocardiaceae bacterium]
MLDPAEVPPSPTATVGEGPLVCPLDLRPRAAAALVGFLATSDAVLSEATLAGPGRTVDAARNHAAEVMSQLAGGSVHVISSTWTVPLPWFALVEPAERQLVLGSADGRREVFWRSPMADVRRRTARAHAVVKDTIGEDGPAGILRDTGRWLENFHPHSVVELDYGGLVQLLDEDELRADTSAQDVHAIVDAMAAGKVEEVGVLYERLSEFWGGLAARERAN